MATGTVISEVGLLLGGTYHVLNEVTHTDWQSYICSILRSRKEAPWIDHPSHLPRNVTLSSPTLYPTSSQICWGRSVTKLYSSVKDQRILFVHIRRDALERTKTLGRMWKPRWSYPPSFSMTSAQSVSRSTAGKILTEQGYLVMGEVADLHLSSSYSALPKMCNGRVPLYTSVMPSLPLPHTQFLFTW
jgi:hypothetical protein